MQKQEMKDSCWRFGQSNLKTTYFFKTTESNGSIYVKFPLRNAAILIIENDGKLCFFWSILAHLHPCENTEPDRVSVIIDEQFFNDLYFNGFDFTNGIKRSDVHILEKKNNLSINQFEFGFYREGTEWNYKLVPIELIKFISDTVFDLLI